MTEFAQFVVGGLAVGSIYGLIALGFVVIYKSTEIFNFAQGELVMVGAYVCFAFMSTSGLSLPLAIVATLAFAAILGWLIQAVVFKPMLGSSLLTMVMVTVGLSMILRSVVFIIYGPQDKDLPERLPSRGITIGGMVVSELDMIVMASAAVCIVVLGAFFRFSRMGLQLRAIGENPGAAAVVGINANRMFTIAMVIGTTTAAVGGILLANQQVVSTQLSAIGLLAFPAAVLGGMRSIPGAVVGGIVIGVLGNLAAGYLGGTEANVVVYVVLFLVLLVRPEGILGQREVERV